MALLDSALALSSSADRLDWMRQLTPAQLETLQRQITDRSGEEPTVSLSASPGHVQLKKIRVGRHYMQVPNAAKYHRLRDSQVLTYFRGRLQMWRVRGGKIVEQPLGLEDRRYLAKTFFKIRL